MSSASLTLLACLAAAAIRAIHLDTNVAISTETNAEGNCSLGYPLPGEYTVTANKPGFDLHGRRRQRPNEFCVHECFTRGGEVGFQYEVDRDGKREYYSAFVRPDGIWIRQYLLPGRRPGHIQ